MDISILNWITFTVAFFYLLIIPGANVIRTMGWVKKKGYTIVEFAVVSFGISVAILVLVSLALALWFSVGLNFFTLAIAETAVIILTTKEVISFLRTLVKKPSA